MRAWTDFFNRSFLPSNISLWNQLPLDIRNSPSLLVFKSKHKLEQLPVVCMQQLSTRHGPGVNMCWSLLHILPLMRLLFVFYSFHTSKDTYTYLPNTQSKIDGVDQVTNGRGLSLITVTSILAIIAFTVHIVGVVLA